MFSLPRSFFQPSVQLFPNIFYKSQEEEQRQLAHSVMGKKTKRLYDRMKHGIGLKDSKAAALRAKAEAIEADEGKQGKGKGKGRAAGAQAEAPAAKKAKRR